MTKKNVDYKEHMDEVAKAFVEDRVLLVSCGREGAPNVMAIGWGVIGIIWRRPVFVILVRPSRHSYTLIEETGEFTVNIVSPQMKEVVQYCGTVSGRDHDKFREKGLTPISSTKVKAPIIKEGLLHFECRVIYKSDVVPTGLEESIVNTIYPRGDFHRIYFGEILACQQDL